MGIALRQREYLDIVLAPLIWKLIAGESVTLSDYSTVDVLKYRYLNHLKSMDASCFDEASLDPQLMGLYPVYFTTEALDNCVVRELHRGGASDRVTGTNLAQFCVEAEEYLLKGLRQVVEVD